MTTIALVGNKGGAGKTTLCVNTAAGIARRGSVRVLDSDPQRSTLQWRTMRETDDIDVVDAVDDLPATYAAYRDGSEHVVIDCPPSVDAPQTLAALRLADVVLIPVQPSPLDIWATVHIEREVDEALPHNPELRPLLVINQLEPRTRLSRMMRQALSELSVPVAEVAVRRRMAFRMSALEGRSVFEFGSRGAAAAEEIQQLIHEVMTR
jgi:chromosome partitioning protein